LRIQQTAAFLLAALLIGLFAGGCGGGDSETTGGAETTALEGGGEGPDGTANGGEGQNGGKTAGNKGRPGNGGAGEGGADNGKGHQNFNREPTSKEVRGFKAPAGGDDSIQTYGTTAEEDQEEEIVSAMRSFFRALASLDYKGICEGITESNREAFLRLAKAKGENASCESLLEGLLLKQSTDEARRAAYGVVYQVRVEDGNAFVLFTPEGDTARYFVMKEEDGTWKATGINAGSPMNPLAGT
jgi:hypothetical protein